jgi:hypothetical protein
MADSHLVTSEMMQAGAVPLLFIGGASNIQTPAGPVRNTGRDQLARWLDNMGWSYFDPQIHPSTHGRDYIWGIDGPQEKMAREIAKLRLYEINPFTIAAVSMMEILDDARRKRISVVWYNGGRLFKPYGIGDRDELRSNEPFRRQIGEAAYWHLDAYVNAGRHIRIELQKMLQDCANIVFVESFDEVKSALVALLHRLNP